jgi:hypothetical protein
MICLVEKQLTKAILLQVVAENLCIEPNSHLVKNKKDDNLINC